MRSVRSEKVKSKKVSRRGLHLAMRGNTTGKRQGKLGKAKGKASPRKGAHRY